MKDFGLYNENFTQLFLYLKEYKNMTLQEFVNILGIKLNTWRYKVKHGVFTCADVENICNTFCVPLSCFVAVGDDKPALMFESENWHPVHINVIAMLDYVSSQTNLLATLKIVGITHTGWYYMLKQGTLINKKFMFVNYLKWCCALKVNIESFAYDPNTELPYIDNFTTISSTDELRKANKRLSLEVRRLQKENNELRKVFMEISKMVVSVKSKYTTKNSILNVEDEDVVPDETNSVNFLNIAMKDEETSIAAED